MRNNTFEAEFKRRLESLIERGAKNGLTLTDICNDAGVARATPDRWRHKSPKTVVLLDKMERVVAVAEDRQAGGKN